MLTKITMSNNWKLVICVCICQLAGILSGLLTSIQNNEWYARIIKPSWNPPGYIFGPIWTILYLLMAISVWIIWKSKTEEPYKSCAILLFLIQLFLNFIWSLLFFNCHSPLSAFVDIILLIIIITITIFRFSEISKTAAWLLVPYISWVFFAALLNYKLWILNS